MTNGALIMNIDKTMYTSSKHARNIKISGVESSLDYVYAMYEPSPSTSHLVKSAYPSLPLPLHLSVPYYAETITEHEYINPTKILFPQSHT